MLLYDRARPRPRCGWQSLLAHYGRFRVGAVGALHRGMRIRVKDVLDLLAARVPEKEIRADYPDLQAEDIQACLEYAAVQLAGQRGH